MKDTHNWVASCFHTTGTSMKCSKCGIGKLFAYREGNLKCKGKKNMKNNFKILEKLKGKKIIGISYRVGQELIYFHFKGGGRLRINMDNIILIEEKWS